MNIPTKEKVVATVNDILKKAGVKFSIEAAVPKKVQCAKSGTDATGITIETPTDWTVDAEVFTTDADGNQTPLADGSYTVDGFAITVMGGKIAEVSTAAEESQDVEMSEAIEQAVAPLAEQIATLETSAVAQALELSTAKTELAKIQKERDELSEKLVKLSTTPAVGSVTDKATEVKSDSNVKLSTWEARKQRTDALRKALDEAGMN